MALPIKSATYPMFSRAAGTSIVVRSELIDREQKYKACRQGVAVSEHPHWEVISLYRRMAGCSLAFLHLLLWDLS